MLDDDGRDLCGWCVELKLRVSVRVVLAQHGADAPWMSSHM